MTRILLSLSFLLVVFLIPYHTTGQSMYFGVKGGPVVAFQKWNGYQETKPLLALHLMGHVESYGDESVFFLNAGINPKGRGLRYNDYVSPITGRVVRGGYSRIIFKNAEIGTGIKRYYEWTEDIEFFYSFGLRLSYTYGSEFGNIRYINTNAIRKWNYGVSVGGGFRLKSNEFFRPLLHISFSPDLSQQVYVPQQELQTPAGDRFTMPEQGIKNTSMEVGVTLQFLRKVIYN